MTVATCVAVGVSQAPWPAPAQAAGPSEILGPQGSGAFGRSVTVLPNGNFVVTDPLLDSGYTDVGAVYLYDGATRQLISTLRGSHQGDSVASEGIVVVGGSNFVVLSPLWDNGGLADAGALTWVNGTTGLNADVGPANSLVGSHASDKIGYGTTTVLTNGNFVETSSNWDDVAVVDAGATTWGSGTAGITGAISAANSIIGSHLGDSFTQYVVALTNGNYVVSREYWASSLGAVTWGDGTSGTHGVVSAVNSLIGAHPSDQVGTSVTALTNGNYVVGSLVWDLVNPLITIVDAGAATWRPGTSASPVIISIANSLVGQTAGDEVGWSVKALANGNYVVGSPLWDSGLIADSGAATWGDGATGSSGAVAAANSLTSSSASSYVASSGIVALTNGNYVVSSREWDNVSIANVGAATWRSGTSASPAVVSSANSLISANASDGDGAFVVALTNGNYVVSMPNWYLMNIGHVGATTWGNGTSGVSGFTFAANSLIGAQSGDLVGTQIVPLANGNYVVGSFQWHFGANAGAGAATWRSGSTSAAGVVSSANSLVGSSVNDHIGMTTIPLPGGDYIVQSQGWNNGELIAAGAVTRGNGTVGTSGVVSAANSVVGSVANDNVGEMVLPVDGGGVVTFTDWSDAGGLHDVGSATFIPDSGLTGPVSAANSYVGPTALSGPGINVAPRFVPGRALAIGVPALNKVVLFTPVEYVPVNPARLVDTRPGSSTVDGQFAGQGVRPAGSTLQVTVAGRGGVPANASAATFNVTAVDAGGNGFVTVFPCGQPQPTASNLNVTTGATVPNAVIAKLGAGGTLCIFTSQPLDLVVDVNGWFPASATYVSSNPARVLDTRPGEVTADGLQQGAGLAAAGSVTELQVGGRVGVAADASSVALNVTITEPSAAGYATVYPCGATPPTASSLNYAPGATVANLVVTRIGAGGKVCIFTQQAAHLIADVNGSFPALTSFASLNPARLLETRSGLTTIDGLFNGAGLRSAGSITTLAVTGRGGVPLGAATVVLNVTVTEPQGAGFVTVYPCGIDPPLASNLNYGTNQTIANTVIVKVGAGGTVCILNSQPTHLVTDITGYFPT